MADSRVLIIEGDRRMVDELQDRLEQRGCEPEIALTREVGLSILGERKMDAAVLDAQIGSEEDPLDLLRELKETDPSLPVILINGVKGREMSRMARRAGAARVVSNPADPDRVVSAIDKVLAT